MGLMDKVKFWQSDDDIDLDSELPPLEEEDEGPTEQSETPEELAPKSDYGTPRDYDKPENQAFSQQPQQPQMQQGTTGDIQKDLDLISSKLDAIKSELDSMDQRIRKIEKIAEGEAGNNRKNTRASRDPWSNY